MDDNYELFKKDVYSLTKIDLNAYKERQMKRRIDTLITKHNYKTYSDFVGGLKTNKDLFKEFVNYHDNYDSNCMIYLNLTTIVTPEGKLWQLVNEMPWADSFSDSDRGYITEESLKVYYDYVVSGAFIDVNKFKSIGGLKKSMKHFGNLEFLLRASNSSENPIIFVVPKLSYSHTTMREGSVSYNEYNTITKKEAEYWRDKAMEIYTCHEDNATDDNNALESEEA